MMNISDSGKSGQAGLLRCIAAGMLILCFLATAAKPSPGTHPEEQNQEAKNRGKFLLVPVIFYSPETNFAAGAAGMYTFRVSGDRAKTWPSTVNLICYYTLNKQYWIEAKPDIYLKNNDYQITGTLNYTKFLDRFWGVGANARKEDEEKYVSLISRVNAMVFRKLQTNLSVGGVFEYEHNKVIEVEPGGQLDTGGILGSDGGTTSGVGAALQWDSRDSIFFPSQGYFCQFSVKLFKQFLGSNYSFSLYNLDFRKYISVFSSHVLAFQGYLNIMTGEPPLQMLSRLGGQNLMRGFYRGRYRDKNMAVLQAEYRMPVWWRLGLVGFIGVGDVAASVRSFALKTLKTGVGLGLRFMINPEDKINVRLDIGFSKEYVGVYFSINEAF